MKRCSPPPTTMEMQVKAAWPPPRWQKITCAGEDTKKKGGFIYTTIEVEVGTATYGKPQGGSSQIQNYHIIQQTPYLDIYPKEIKTGCWRDMCTPIFIGSIIQRAKIWKWLKCLSTGNGLKKKKKTHTLKYISVLRKEESYLYTTSTTQMNLEDIMLSDTVVLSCLSHVRLFATP